MPEPGEQLRRYFDATAPAVETDPVVVRGSDAEVLILLEEHPKHRARSARVLVATVVITVAGLAGAALLWTGDRSDGTETDAVEQPEPTVMSVTEGQALIERFADTLRAGDVEGARSLVIETSPGPDFIGWWVTLDLSGLEFFECEYEPGSVTCQMTVGADHWYSRVHGQNVVQRFTATLAGGLIVEPGAPVTSIDLETEAAFQTWAKETHPELDGVMFDSASPAGVAFTVESGQARMELLDEYLSYQAETLTDSFVAALRSGDPDAARPLVVGNEPGPDFIGWFMSLDTTGVEFFECEYEPGAVTCQTTLGAGHWFERIHGEDTELTFSATLEGRLIIDPEWPVRPADLAAEQAFRIWAEETHPELGEIMFDSSSFAGVAFTVESGQARTQLLDEYLASLSPT